MTWTNGTATISAGDTSKAVTHECGATPESVQVTPSTNLETRGWRVSSVGATTFTINITSADPINDHTFYWRAGTDDAEPGTPSYTSEAKIEAVTSLSITATSVPTTNQVAVWITEVEADISERALGSHTATDNYLDVPEKTENKELYEWTYAVDTDRLTTDGGRTRLVPVTNARRPIISITSLYKNDENPDSAASWDELTEGPGDGSSFILRQSGDKQHGYVLQFYDNLPLHGSKRIKWTYTYGENISTYILARWATLKVAVKVLTARMGTSSTDNLTYIDAGDFGMQMNTRYRERIQEFKDEIQKIEDDHFPDPADRAGVSYVVF